MNAIELAEQLEAGAAFPAYPSMPLVDAADMLRRQHEAIKQLREALESMCEGDSQAIIEAEALGIPFPDEMLTEYRKAQQALKDTEYEEMTEHNNFQYVGGSPFGNRLTLVQVNPDCAVQLDARDKAYGWLYIKGADGQWVTQRKLTAGEIEMAHDQEADGYVMQGTKARQG